MNQPPTAAAPPVPPAPPAEPAPAPAPHHGPEPANRAAPVPGAGAGAADFHAQFDQWLAHRRDQAVLRQASSMAVYRSMWAAFATWCGGQGRALHTLDAGLIEAFVLSRADASALSDRHAWRWLTLLDAVLRQGTPAQPPNAGAPAREPGATACHRVPPNRAAAELLHARPAWRYANASALDPLPEFLDAAQARQLVDWLRDERRDHSVPGAAAGSWQALRNRAAVALQLGAGLTPGDVRAATVAGVLAPQRRAGVPWRLRVPAHGAITQRDAPMAAWAGRLLQQWLAARAAAGLPGEVLFPGTRQGKPWAKVAQYNAANAVLAAAGLGQAGGGSFALRHTFALRQLRRGHSPEDVARWLGVSDPGVLARYQRVVFELADLA